MLTYLSGVCGLFPYLDHGDASLQRLIPPLSLDFPENETKRRPCSKDSS